MTSDNLSNKYDFEKLNSEYLRMVPLGVRIAEALEREISKLVDKHNVTLGVPLESRVKAWDSIKEKLDRKSIELKTINTLDDFVGIRVIVLFQKDLSVVKKFIHDTFNVLSDENVSDRLESNQFGYLSEHLIIKIPEAWLGVPSYSDFGNVKVEIQIRTLAQHIWAAASHKLQYKREESVPVPVRRATHRVSALLETVDLEFTRVLVDRDAYLTSVDHEADDQFLNVDLVLKVLEENLPETYRHGNENIDELLLELQGLKIDTKSKLISIIDKNKEQAMKENNKIVEKIKNGSGDYRFNEEAISRGIFYNYMGLLRCIFEKEFGKEKVIEMRQLVGTFPK